MNEIINLKLVNNLSTIVPTKVMEGKANPFNNLDTVIVGTWDMTGDSFPTNYSLSWGGANAGVVSSSSPLNNLQEIADDLNTKNIGVFSANGVILTVIYPLYPEIASGDITTNIFATGTPTSYPNEIVTITSQDDTTYDQIQQSLGSFIYEVKNIYLKSNSTDQILEPLRLNKYDSNGNISYINTIPIVDPTQYQPAVNIKWDKFKKYVLDGKSSISFNMLGNETVYMRLEVKRIAIKDLLTSKTIFDDDFFKENDYFSGFKNRID